MLSRGAILLHLSDDRVDALLPLHLTVSAVLVVQRVPANVANEATVPCPRQRFPFLVVPRVLGPEAAQTQLALDRAKAHPSTELHANDTEAHCDRAINRGSEGGINVLAGGQ